MTPDPELIAFGQWLVNQGVAVAALAATVLYIGRKLDDGNRILDSLLIEQRTNGLLLNLILTKLGIAPPPKQ